MNLCKCCGNPLNGQLCSYCGFIEQTYSDIESSLENDVERQITAYKNTAEYREMLLAHISAFSVKAQKFKWNEKKNTFGTLDSIELFDQHLTGKDYYCRFTVSDTEVHQIGIGEKQSIAVDYKFSGTPKSATVELVPVQTDKPWQFGLQINKKLQLLVALGDFSSSKYAAAVIDLDFHV